MDVAPDHGTFVVNGDNTMAMLNCDTAYYQTDVNGITAVTNDSFICKNGIWAVLTLLTNKCAHIPCKSTNYAHCCQV